MATDTATAELRKGDRVVAVEALRGVPKGTVGRVHMVNGLGPWIRCWVQFDNGVWMGSISADKLVRENELADYERRREEAAKAAAEAAAKPKEAPKAEAAAGDGAAAGGAASKVPAHLLERAKKARERKAAAG